MREQLINLETFTLAKEKGFNIEICRCGGYPECICEDLKPTQGLLQKWIRDNYCLHIRIETNALFDKDDIRYSWNIFGFYDGRFRLRLMSSDSSMKKLYNDKEEFNTYEEALEVALLESLKLIP